MRQRVESYGLKKEEVDGIMRKLEEGHYQIACGLHFAAVHLKELSTGSVSHPNQWYLESRGEVAGQGAGKSNKNVKTVRASVYSQNTQPGTQSQETEDDQSQLDLMDDSELLEMMSSTPST